MTRTSKLTSLFPERVDAMLVTDEISIRYLTDFPFEDGFLLITRDDPFLCTDFRYVEAAQASCPDFRVKMFVGDRWELLAELLEKSGVKNLLFEDTHCPVSMLNELKERFPGVAFLPAGELVEGLMAIKDEGEYKNILRAQRIAEEGLGDAFASVCPEITEKEFAYTLEYTMMRAGSEERAFPTIAITGETTSRPHGVPQDVCLRKGFLTIDFGAKYNGYCSDMTRTVSLGRATDEMKKVYQTVLDAQKTALDLILSGERNCRKIDGAARDLIENAGYHNAFGHGLGHGVGLRIHEAPRLSPRCGENEVLLPGHIVTVEPGIYLAGKFGVRIEDMVYIRENDAVNLTTAPKELVEL